MSQAGASEAEESLRDGDVEGALARLQDRVRRNPGDARLRVFLFQLLSVLGQWGRALTQLKVVGDLDAGALAMVQTYREALQAEAFRAQVFQGKRAPLVLGKPEEWLALLIEAVRLQSDGQGAHAQEVRDRAFDLAPASPGHLDGTEFAWISDADPRLGPVLEVVLSGGYYWVPFERIASIIVTPPEDLRDLIWLPAQFVWSNGGEAVGLIPARYPGSEASEDSQIRLARKTVWEERNGIPIGLGQRILATDAEEKALLEVREVALLNAVPSEGG